MAATIGLICWGVTSAARRPCCKATADAAGEEADITQSMLVIVFSLAVAGGLLLDATGATAFPWALLILALAGAAVPPRSPLILARNADCGGRLVAVLVGVRTGGRPVRVEHGCWCPPSVGSRWRRTRNVPRQPGKDSPTRRSGLSPFVSRPPVSPTWPPASPEADFPLPHGGERVLAALTPGDLPATVAGEQLLEGERGAGPRVDGM
ncbi:hypothetical protein [Streptomyces sp. NPDC049879]|uniref:hypothetical protein n=1 Tax=Streptomyces sp. NPDC049879 TaxID=3365598 RepID=UPI0037A4FD65